jgi:F-type H+-transporting ATPase subunit delta
LEGFVQVFEQMHDLANALENPLYPVPARKALFQAVADKLELTPIMRSFVNLLIEKKRVQNLVEIRDYYGRLIDEHENVARAFVRAAVKLDDATKDSIAQALGKLTGKKIAIEVQEDTSLIGGVVAQIGDLVLDGSVRTQLLGIKESLKRGELG